MTLIKEDTADHGVVGSGSSSETSVKVSPLLGSSAEVPAAAVRQRLRAESVERADRRPSARLGQRFRAERPGCQRRVRGHAAVQGQRFRRDGIRPEARGDQPLPAQRLGDQPSDRRGPRSGTGRLDRARPPVRRGDPDDGPDEQASKPSAKPKAKPSKAKPSLAATPPPAVKKGEKDIFDDTDFEVDVALSDGDSDDKTVQLEAASDFDLEDNDTGSEVFAIDEEAVDQNASTAMAPSAFAEDDEDEEDDGFDSAVSSEMGAWSSTEGSGEPGPRRRRPWSWHASPTRNGAASGSACSDSRRICLFFAAFVAHDLVRNLYEFQSGGTMGSGLVRMISGMFGG